MADQQTLHLPTRDEWLALNNEKVKLDQLRIQKLNDRFDKWFNEQLVDLIEKIKIGDEESYVFYVWDAFPNDGEHCYQRLCDATGKLIDEHPPNHYFRKFNARSVILHWKFV